MDIVNLIDILFDVFGKLGYPIIFFGSLIEITPLGWTVPGSAILLTAGFFSNNNDLLPIVPVIIVGTLGAWIALIIAYVFGKKSGMWLVKKLKQEKNAKFAKSLLEKNGGVILTTSMLANLTRFWIAYIAGVENYNFWKFNLYAITASLSWVSLMTLLGFFAGYERENLKHIVGGVGILAWLFLIIAILVIYKTAKHEYKHFKKGSPHELDENHK